MNGHEKKCTMKCKICLGCSLSVCSSSVHQKQVSVKYFDTGEFLSNWEKDAREMRWGAQGLGIGVNPLN